MPEHRTHRTYSHRQVIDYTDRAAILGTVKLAVQRLDVPASTLRGWLQMRGYRIVQGRILDPELGQES